MRHRVISNNRQSLLSSRVEVELIPENPNEEIVIRNVYKMSATKDELESVGNYFNKKIGSSEYSPIEDLSCVFALTLFV